MDVYAVGGTVRDMLLGRSGQDRDFLVLRAAPEEFLRAFPKAKLVGKSFQVALLEGHEYAFSDSDDIFTDLNRRDLTINAIALDAAGRLYTHPQTLQDLLSGVLRPVSDHALDDDPVRAFRAARFLARLLDFEPHPSLIESMRRIAAEGGLARVAAERICGETLKALSSPKPSRFLSLLKAGGCLSPWFAELDSSAAVPGSPRSDKPGEPLEHVMAVMDRLAGSPLLVWMGLCHGLGTAPRLRAGGTDTGTNEGETAKKIGERLSLPGKYIDAGIVARAEVAAASRYPALALPEKVDLLALLHAKGLVRELFALVQADCGLDHLPQAEDDLRTMLAVHLPEQYRDKGRESGDMLRQLRVRALDRRSP